VSGRASSRLGSTLGFRACRRSLPARVALSAGYCRSWAAAAGSGRRSARVRRGLPSRRILARTPPTRDRSARGRAAERKRTGTRACLRGRAGRHPAEGVPDDDGIVRAVEGVDDHLCILGGVGVDVLAGHVRGDDGGRALRVQGSGRPTPRRRAKRRARARTSKLLPTHALARSSSRAVRSVRIRRVSKCVICGEPAAGWRGRRQCALAASEVGSPARSSSCMFLIVVRA
jgi:hypothetical protein